MMISGRDLDEALRDGGFGHDQQRRDFCPDGWEGQSVTPQQPQPILTDSGATPPADLIGQAA